MELTTLIWIYIGLCSVCWGIYPVLANTVPGVHPAWMSALLVIGSLTGSLGLLGRPPAPTGNAAMKILFCGAILGLGMFIFGKLQVVPNLDVGKVFPIILGLMCIVTAVAGAVVVGNPFTATRALGLAIIIIGVYVIS